MFGGVEKAIGFSDVNPDLTRQTMVAVQAMPRRFHPVPPAASA